MQFEQTFMNFLMNHQEKYNRTHNFLILMDALIGAAKHIQRHQPRGLGEFSRRRGRRGNWRRGVHV